MIYCDLASDLSDIGLHPGHDAVALLLLRWFFSDSRFTGRAGWNCGCCYVLLSST